VRFELLDALADLLALGRTVIIGSRSLTARLVRDRYNKIDRSLETENDR
jgi:hypothetical protein